jgi:hypothetical protein
MLNIQAEVWGSGDSELGYITADQLLQHSRLDG